MRQAPPPPTHLPASAEPVGVRGCVMRQDDNGNAFAVAHDLDREAAEAMAAEFERRGHKQVDWIRRQ